MMGVTIEAVETCETVPTFAPSKYQAEIFDFILNGSGDAMVEAVAGSGKTTTLVQAARLISNMKAAFFAFNKHISLEIGRKLGLSSFTVSTIHAYGYKTIANAVYAQSKGKVKKLVTSDTKYSILAQEFINMTLSPQERHRFMVDATYAAQIKARGQALTQLVNFVRLTLTPATDLEGIERLIARYDITIDPKDTEEGEQHFRKGVLPVIKKGIALYRERGQVDFADMIFLPYALDLRPEQFMWVLVDEAQDLNAAQRWLVQAGRAPGGRMLFVGDSRQAIMGFAGADTASFFKIQEETSAAMLPLSICYRCPIRHLNLARLVVPSIENREGASEGVVNAIHDLKAVQAIREAIETSEDGVLVLSRTTAPLVGLCIKLIKSRIAARVRGRDIAQGLVDIAETCGKMTGVDFLDALDLYESKQVAKLSKKEGNDNRIATLQDKCEALRVCWTEFTGVDTVGKLIAEINNIFDDKQPAVWLSTIHRAKGLESSSVFILNPKKLPFSHPKQTPEDVVQEYNLLYVALTRSTNALTFVHPDNEELPAPGDDVENLSLSVG